jgi:hypothetical protein
MISTVFEICMFGYIQRGRCAFKLHRPAICRSTILPGFNLEMFTSRYFRRLSSKIFKQIRITTAINRVNNINDESLRGEIVSITGMCPGIPIDCLPLHILSLSALLTKTLTMHASPFLDRILHRRASIRTSHAPNCFQGLFGQFSAADLLPTRSYSTALFNQSFRLRPPLFLHALLALQ